MTSEVETDLELEQAIRATYATALKHCHEGGSIALHMSPDVVAYVKRAAVVMDDRIRNLLTPRMFGFPIVEEERLPARSIQVHVVHYVI